MALQFYPLAYRFSGIRGNLPVFTTTPVRVIYYLYTEMVYL